MASRNTKQDIDKQYTMPDSHCGIFADLGARLSGLDYTNQICQTVEDSVSMLPLSDNEEESGIQTIPYTLNVKGSKQSNLPREDSKLLCSQGIPDLPSSIDCSNTKASQQTSFFSKSSPKRSISRVEDEQNFKPTSTRNIKKNEIIVCLPRKRSSTKVINSIFELIKRQSHTKYGLKKGSQKRCNIGRGSVKNVSSALITPKDKGKGSFFIKGHFYSPMHNITILTKEDSVIQESIEESLMADYWQRMEEIEDKYKRLLANLAVEEASEIKLQTSKFLMNKSNSCYGRIAQVISAIKEEYEIVKSLMLKQKLLEEEEVVAQFSSILSKKP